ncbi:hypothetical protein AB0B89_09480 [Sphaerisporangium sp. NPDC049002]|uniref:hypothetical protein n=1 Tax=unclassified Sphaerisporangium TaxID=2630420 RepID=UPI0033C28F2F
MSSPSEFRPPSTLLLREVPAHTGTAGGQILAPVLTAALREASAVRCRVYVLSDLAGPAAAPPLAAALVETDPAAHRARLRALTVIGPYRGLGLERRLLGELLTELRAAGVRQVCYRAEPGAGDLPALLRSSGFTGDERTPCQYDEPGIGPLAVTWLIREL